MVSSSRNGLRDRGGQEVVLLGAAWSGTHARVYAVSLIAVTSLVVTTTAAFAAPPAPTITSPSSYSWHRATSVTVSGTAASGSTVELFVGGSSRGTTAATGGSWSRTLTGLEDGDYLVTARASDATGQGPSFRDARAADRHHRARGTADDRTG